MTAENGRSSTIDVPRRETAYLVVHVVHEGPDTRVVLAGDLDFHTVGRVRSVLEDECALQPETIGIDLAAVQFADSHALRLFVETHRRLGKQGCALTLLHPSDQLRRILAITKLDGLLETQPAL